MEIGIVGLGRMGANIVRRLIRHQHQCVVYNRTPDKVELLESEGAFGATDIIDMVTKLPKPAVVWVMVTPGSATEQTINELAQVMEAGAIIIDGGNSYYKDDVRRAKFLEEKGIHYVDIGISGGVWSLERGYCMVIGGETEVVQYIDPILNTLAPGVGDMPKTLRQKNQRGTSKSGYLHCGAAGAGHFVKMVHSGVESPLMRFSAEGFDILNHAISQELAAESLYDLNIADIAEVWQWGSEIGSWTLDSPAIALQENSNQ